MRRYLIYYRVRGSHGYIALAHDESMVGAIGKYLSDNEQDLLFPSDGSVLCRGGSHELSYPHVLAYVEALYKTTGEWQIKQVATQALNGTGIDDLLVCEHPDEVDAAVRRCRPNLWRDVPRSRARAFLWYTSVGTIVTYYKKRRDYQIDVVGRYLIHRRDNQISRWEGGYNELVSLLDEYDYVVR